MISTETSLLLRLQSRDDSAAWLRFVRLYTPLLDHWAWRLTHNSEHAADLVQEVFLGLWGNISLISQRPPQSFRAWLRTVMLNRGRDFLRRQKHPANPKLLEQIEAAIDDPNELLTAEEYQTYVAQAALQLMRDCFSGQTFEACYQSVVRGRPAKEVAAELGISENAVYLARGRVLTRLRQELIGLWED